MGILMQIFYVVIAVSILGFLLYVPYYVVAFILLWPRVLAIHVGNKEPGKVKKLWAIFLISQFLIFLVSVFTGIIYGPDQA
jgi:hypothetical protein